VPQGYSYCGTSGALTTLDFGQLFVGEASDVAKPRSRCKFAPLIEFGEFKDQRRLWRPWIDCFGRNWCAQHDGE
jgi:hypothetical protein